MFTIKKKYKVLAMVIGLFVSGITYGSGEEFMPVSEIREGMRGYAKTVVHGTKIETFDVDVLGIMKKKGANGGDLILVKVSGPLIDQTEGIAQGMSGSPVYIDGKLIGAVAYGFSQSGGRIGMVTPISDMLNLWLVDDKKNQFIPQPSDHLIPITTPLMASGYTEKAMEYLTKKMGNFHMTPVSSVTSGDDDVPRPLEAGSAVAASMVTGDLRLGAIGTVTYVDKNRMLAFGHPFMTRGSSNYFMHNSYIYTVVPSKNIPFKMGSVGAEIGIVNQDRGAGIAGISGEFPQSVALHVSVNDKDVGTTENLNVRMIDNEALLPTLSTTSIYTAMSRAMDREGSGTVSFTYTLYPKDTKKEPFRRTNMYWSSRDIAERSVDEIYQVMRLLLQNRFKAYPLRSISMDMNVTKDRKTAQLLDASATPVVVSPGDKIYVRVRLEAWRGNIFYKNLTFTVPKNQPLGSMMLEVRGGGVVPLPYLFQQQKYNLTDEIISRLNTRKDFDDLYKKLLKEDQNNQIVVEIIEPDVSMVPKGESVNAEKPDIQTKKEEKKPDYLKEKDSSNEKKKDEEQPKSKIDTDYIILGDGQFTFKVVSPEERDRELKKMADEHKKLSATMSDKKTDKEKEDDKKDKKETESADKKNDDKNSEEDKESTMILGSTEKEFISASSMPWSKMIK